MVAFKGELGGYVAFVILHSDDTRCTPLRDPAGPIDGVFPGVKAAFIGARVSSNPCFLLLHMPFV